MKTLIKNIKLVTQGEIFSGAVLIEGEEITKISRETDPKIEADNIIDGKNKLLIPGIIDDQVHFREPGLTHKGNIKSESAAAAAGGVTSYMEMPNTNPQATNIETLNQKFDIAEENSFVNYSFYMGATNDNINEILKIDPQSVCGLKVFMGSSTGNMLVDKHETLSRIFKESPVLVATHCEDEDTIVKNTSIYKNKYGEDNIPISAHYKIRSEEA